MSQQLCILISTLKDHIVALAEMEEELRAMIYERDALSTRAATQDREQALALDFLDRSELHSNSVPVYVPGDEDEAYRDRRVGSPQFPPVTEIFDEFIDPSVGQLAPLRKVVDESKRLPALSQSNILPPADGYVLVLVSTLRDHTVALAEMEEELRAVIYERDALSTRAATQDREQAGFRAELARTFAAHQSALLQSSQSHAADTARLRESLSEKDAHISRLLSQLNDLQQAGLVVDPISQSVQPTSNEEDLIELSAEVGRQQELVAFLQVIRVPYTTVDLAISSISFSRIGALFVQTI